MNCLLKKVGGKPNLQNLIINKNDQGAIKGAINELMSSKKISTSLRVSDNSLGKITIAL